MLNIVIPMAGAGSRFSKAGYERPKPLIEFLGKTMIEWVIENLTIASDHRFIFICQKSHVEQYGFQEIFAKNVRSKFDIVTVDGLTEGATCTVLAAKHLIANTDDMVIANSDQIVEVDFQAYIDESRAMEADGSIMVFEDDDPKWSFARLDSEGFVSQVAEKNPISNIATVGIYYFSQGRHFVDASETMIRVNDRVNNEFYVCPVYNYMIQAGRKVRVWSINKKAMHGVGTPEDLRAYIHYKTPRDGSDASSIT